MASAQTSLRARDLDHADLLVAQVASETSAIGAGPLNADGVELALRAEPAAKPSIAGIVGRELGDTEKSAGGVDGRRAMGGGVGVDIEPGAPWENSLLGRCATGAPWPAPPPPTRGPTNRSSHGGWTDHRGPVKAPCRRPVPPPAATGRPVP